ncbi:MAG: ftsQ [Acidimicrobiales bacterium]|nr:ftsQ [Acidimicrobiales bacterium]
MSEPGLPLGEGSVPDKALEELLAAFADSPPVEPDAIDFDDPSIDRMLGLSEPLTDAPVAAPDEPHADGAPPPITERVETVAPAPVVSSPDPVAAPVTEVVSATEPPAPPRDPAPARATIKIGGSEEHDLPDAFYFDEEASDRLRGAGRSTEASIHEERTTILIADDGMEGSVGGIPTAAGSSMDPRLRARRIAVKRAVGRRRLKWFVIVGVIIVLITSGIAVLGSSLFAVNNIDDISISGARRISRTDLDAAINRILHHPVLLIDTHAIEVQLERSPWVREARVSTDFPHKASIELLERVPLATYAGPDGRFRIIDVQGRVVDVIANQPVEFMLITGQGVNASAGTSAGEGFTHAAELVEALSPAVRSRTKSVDVSDSGGLSLQFHNGATVVLGAPTELLDKLTRLEAFLETDNDQCTGTINVATIEIDKCSS